MQILKEGTDAQGCLRLSKRFSHLTPFILLMSLIFVLHHLFHVYALKKLMAHQVALLRNLMGDSELHSSFAYSTWMSWKKKVPWHFPG